MSKRKPTVGRASARAVPSPKARQEPRPTNQLREDAPPYTVAAVCDRREADERRSQSAATKPRFIDLFCGIGGFRLAFERAGGQCVFSSDWNEPARITYEANHGELPKGDIHTVAVADIPAHDILCAGFPRQPFSIAGVSKKLSLGKKHGFEDTEQGNLFFTLADIIDYHRPKLRFETKLRSVL